MKDFNLQPTLENQLIKIRPLKKGDFEALFKVASNPEIWEQHPAKERSTREGFEAFFDKAICAESAFVIIDKAKNEIIGSSRFTLNRQSDKAIEIGFTFLSKAYWGKGFNRAFKFLLMDYAFQHFDYALFYIGETNFRSQKAVENLGGKRIFVLDGIELIGKPNAEFIFCISKNEFEKLKQNDVFLR